MGRLRNLGLAIWLTAGCAGAAAAPRAAAPVPPPVVVPDPAVVETRAGPVSSARPPDLHVRCEDRKSCPAAVGMLVFARDPEEPQEHPQRCTATLIAPDRVLTANHCIAPSARHAGASCSGAWIGFPERGPEPERWVRCGRVLVAAQAEGDGALRQEYAVLQLTRPMRRPPLSIEPAAAEPGSIVTVVSVTPHPVYVHGHALSTRLCRVESPEIATEALGSEAGKVGWLSSCPIDHGNSGSPVLDYEGRVRAIVHGGTSRAYAFGVTSLVPLASNPD
ncbi:MAG: serine protease [Myxococcales bacterium]|nr:serine protease [Myxococcales bacterium]